jgi:hypothetical protein
MTSLQYFKDSDVTYLSSRAYHMLGVVFAYEAVYDAELWKQLCRLDPALTGIQIQTGEKEEQTFQGAFTQEVEKCFTWKTWPIGFFEKPIFHFKYVYIAKNLMTCKGLEYITSKLPLTYTFWSGMHRVNHIFVCEMLQNNFNTLKLCKKL